MKILTVIVITFVFSAILGVMMVTSDTHFDSTEDFYIGTVKETVYLENPRSIGLSGDRVIEKVQRDNYYVMYETRLYTHQRDPIRGNNSHYTRTLVDTRPYNITWHQDTRVSREVEINNRRFDSRGMLDATVRNGRARITSNQDPDFDICKDGFGTSNAIRRQIMERMKNANITLQELRGRACAN